MRFVSHHSCLQPDPRQYGPPSSLYNFPNWSQQVRDFLREVVGGPATLTCNSVGGIAGLQVRRRGRKKGMRERGREGMGEAGKEGQAGSWCRGREVIAVMDGSCCGGLRLHGRGTCLLW